MIKFLEKYIYRRENILLSFVFLSAIIHLVCVNYNRPFQIHPDEGYIYEDPLKVLLSYCHGRFTTEWNLSMISIVFWTPVVFIFGYVSGDWNSFENFKSALIGENFNVLYYYRMLSVVFLFIGNLLLYRIIRKNIESFFIQVLMLLFVLFNALILGTNIFIKMDSIAYVAVIYAYYFIQKNYSNDNKYIHPRVLPVLALLAAARIDIAVIFGLILLFILFDARKQKKELLLLLKYFLFSIIIYLLTTCKPLVFIYRYFHPNYVAETWNSFDNIFFQSAISVIKNNNSSMLFYKIFNITRESIEILFILCPSFLLIFLFKPRDKVGIVFLLAGIIFLVLISTIGTSDFPRHRTLPYLMIYFSILSGIKFVKFTNFKKTLTITLASLQIFPFILMVHEIYLPNNYKKDLTNYILTHTTENDVIAHAGYGMAGYSIDLLSSSSYYTQMAAASKESGAGTGQKALYNAALKNVPRRTIIPVLDRHLFSITSGDPRMENLFLNKKEKSTSKYANKLSFTYDDCSEEFKKSKYYISRSFDEPECLKPYFSLDKKFSPHVTLYPYGGLINNMLFKESFYVWKNKNY